MTPEERLRALARAARVRGVRGLLVIESAPSPSTDDTPSSDRADRLAARLGTENARLVHDARRTLDPALLAAEAGTVPAGGVLTLLVPPLANPASDSARSRAGTRLARLLLAHLAAEPDTSGRMTLGSAATDAFTRRAADESGTTTGISPAPSPAAVSAQDALLERAAAHLEVGERPLLVVEAPRGHGKSALLGRLAARLEREGSAPVLCAAHRSATGMLERHRDAPPGSAPLPFLPPDAALERGGDTLLVDEAASLPLPLLERLLGRWRRVVLATTSAGYESAGRAFTLRLPGTLDRQRPGWLRLTPEVPMRWAAGDPLDALIAHLILSNAAPARPTGRTLANLPELPATRVDRDALAADDARLSRLFGLLAATHYQSTPLDLQHLLDGTGMALWSIEHGHDVLGAALVAIEPGVPPALRDDVLARRRRLPHRLLPQLLAQAANDGAALGAAFARVVRIAVHPAARRRGVGRRLVAGIVRDTGGDVEAVGASFGETPDTRAFWIAGGFVPFHRGHRANPRSGRRALAVLRAHSARTRRVLAIAQAIHRDNESLAVDDTPSPDTPPDAALLARFAAGERSLSDTRAALWRLAHTDGTATIPGHATTPDASGLLDALGIDAGSLSPKAREARLREWAGHRLDGADGDTSPAGA